MMEIVTFVDVTQDDDDDDGGDEDRCLYWLADECRDDDFHLKVFFFLNFSEYEMKIVNYNKILAKV